MNTRIFVITIFTAIGVAACSAPSNTPTNTTSSANRSTAAATPVPPSSPAASTPGLKPGDVSPDKPVSAVDLNKAFFADQAAWTGKPVTITGNYHSHTTSTNASGKTIRVDIADATGKKVANCNVTSEPTKEEVAQRENRTFKGTVKEAYFNEVTLEPCQMLNP